MTAHHEGVIAYLTDGASDEAGRQARSRERQSEPRRNCVPATGGFTSFAAIG